MLTKQEIEGFAALLAGRKRQLAEDVRVKYAESRALTAESAPGEVVDGGDAAQSNVMAEVDLAEAARDEAELRDIDAAERRIAAGTFGICEQCGEEIAPARLAASPAAARCMTCQQRFERAHKEGH